MNPGDIHWIDLPVSAGHEQTGRRPGIVWQDDVYSSGSPLVIVIPMTGALGASRFPGALTIEPSADNGLRKTSVVLAFQIRAVDRHAIREYIGAISSEQRAEIYGLLDQLTGRIRE